MDKQESGHWMNKRESGHWMDKQESGHWMDKQESGQWVEKRRTARNGTREDGGCARRRRLVGRGRGEKQVEEVNEIVHDMNESINFATSRVECTRNSGKEPKAGQTGEGV
eukprot:6207393-Pleurochrysis_carterae.AAC.2